MKSTFTRQQERRLDELRVKEGMGTLSSLEGQEVDALRASYNQFIDEGMANLKRMAPRGLSLRVQGSFAVASACGAILHAHLYFGTVEGEPLNLVAAVCCAWLAVVVLCHVYGWISAWAAVVCHGMQLVSLALCTFAAFGVLRLGAAPPIQWVGLITLAASTGLTGLLLCKVSYVVTVVAYVAPQCCAPKRFPLRSHVRFRRGYQQAKVYLHKLVQQ